MSVYCTASKRTLLERCIMSIDPPDIVFFCEKYLLAMDKYIMVIPARPHWVQIKHLIKNLKNNELGPNVCILTTCDCAFL